MLHVKLEMAVLNMFAVKRKLKKKSKLMLSHMVKEL